MLANCKSCMRVFPYEEAEWCPYYRHTKDEMDELCETPCWECSHCVPVDMERWNDEAKRTKTMSFESEEWGARLKTCPFCGETLIYEFYCWENKNGHICKTMEYVHPEGKCILNEIDALVISAADERDGYLGEHPALWNERKGC